MLLLADIFENFKDLCLRLYGLDANHYAMLKITFVSLKPILDYNMYIMIEKGIRGGISQSI